MFTQDQLTLSRIKLLKQTVSPKSVPFVHLSGNGVLPHWLSLALKKYFRPEEHLFLLVYANDMGDYEYPPNMLPVTADMLALPAVTQILNAAQKIFIHGWPDLLADLVLATPRAPEKTQWIIWGGDIYDYPVTPQRKALIARLRGVIAHVPEEWRLVRQKYGVDIMWTGWGPFYDSGDLAEEHSRLMSPPSPPTHGKDERVKVLVGHGAYPGQNHADMFRRLAARFPGKLEVFSVLAYGDREYTQQVIAAGRRIFGTSFHAVTRYQTRAAYFKFLKRMDIGIFPQYRVQGLGNLTTLLALGKKVFVHSKECPDAVFLSMLGAETAFVEDLDSMDFEAFIRNDHVMANHRAMQLLKSGELTKREWQKLLYGTPLRADDVERVPVYADYVSEKRLNAIDRHDFWTQVRRTRNGQPFPDDQMELIYGEIRRGLQFTPGDVLLDLACGNGRLAQEFMPALAGYHGVDLSPGLIKIARENFASDTAAFTESDAETWLEGDENPERFTKCLIYGAIAYFSIPSVYHMLLLLNRKFKNIGRVFIGPVPDRDKCRDFYGTDDYNAGDFTSSIGMWHTRDAFRRMAEECGWDAEILNLPEASWQHDSRFNAVLSRKADGRRPDEKEA